MIQSPTFLTLLIQAVLRLHGFLNNTVYFGTLICPFSTKSLLCLHSFLITRLFFQSPNSVSRRPPVVASKRSCWNIKSKQYTGVLFNFGPFINSQKILGCDTSQDVLLLVTLRYMNLTCFGFDVWKYEFNMSWDFIDSLKFVMEKNST